MAKIVTGKDIKSVKDIERLILFFCKIKDKYTIQDIYNIIQINLVGSHFIVRKKLYSMIESATTKLINNGFLKEEDGLYFHEPIKFVKVDSTPELSI